MILMIRNKKNARSHSMVVLVIIVVGAIVVGLSGLVAFGIIALVKEGKEFVDED